MTTTSVTALYERISNPAVRAALNHEPRALAHSLRVRRKVDGTIVAVPPLAFLAGGGGRQRRSSAFYDRLLRQRASSVKTAFGTVLERMERGKYSAVRQYSHNTRYVKSGRAVIVPFNAGLEPDECVLPVSLWRRLECPRLILAHRYPTLDDRNFTVHRVVATWIYPVLGIATSIVRGNNADFDGDAMQIIPLTNPASEAEAHRLFHPSLNLLVGMDERNDDDDDDGGGTAETRLRLFFDHDEILTLHHLFGLDGDRLHTALRDLVVGTSSVEAYATFLRLRRLCRRAWEVRVVFALTYSDLLDFIPADDDGRRRRRRDYVRFVEREFPLVPATNTIKRIVLAGSSRFSLDHLWQMVGTVNVRAPDSSFLGGMTRRDYVDMARLSRMALIKDVAYAGYGYIKLIYATRTLILAHDGRVYTLAGDLVADAVEDLI